MWEGFVCDNDWPMVIFISGTCLCWIPLVKNWQVWLILNLGRKMWSWSLFSHGRTPGSTNVSTPASENFTPQLSIASLKLGWPFRVVWVEARGHFSLSLGGGHSRKRTWPFNWGNPRKDWQPRAAAAEGASAPFLQHGPGGTSSHRADHCLSLFL